MKYLLILSIVFFGARVVNAQTDTLRDERYQIPKEVPAAAPADEKESSHMVPVPADRIPPSLREVLLNELYAGWENGGVYQNKDTGEYTVKIKTAGDSIKYWFDEKGQPITALGSAPGSSPN
jgi:hypothetical protein